MSRFLIALAGLVLMLAPPLAGSALADDPDFGDSNNWLCRPGRQDACTIPLDATIVAADGSLSREAFKPDPDPAIDCFYVYPTVSNQPNGNADLTIDPEERRVVAQQFARFGAKCRLFAPMYRQVTLAGLRAYMAGSPIQTDRAMAYNDVVAAWKYYLAHDNHGRGVVLVGHSQGSLVLTELIKNEIDSKPNQALMVSAILMGTSLPVPPGGDMGGVFRHIPACHAADQTSCVIAFASFRANVPPPANSRFGKAPPGMQALCANPAALGGGPAELDAYLSSRRSAVASDGSGDVVDWTKPPQPIETRFVKVPGMLTAECVTDEHGSYLAITVHPSPNGARIGEISGDVRANGKVQEDWGLHLIDANLTMGNLLSVVGDQAKAYLARAGQ